MSGLSRLTYGWRPALWQSGGQGVCDGWCRCAFPASLQIQGLRHPRLLRGFIARPKLQLLAECDVWARLAWSRRVSWSLLALRPRTPMSRRSSRSAPSWISSLQFCWMRSWTFLPLVLARSPCEIQWSWPSLRRLLCWEPRDWAPPALVHWWLPSAVGRSFVWSTPWIIRPLRPWTWLRSSTTQGPQEGLPTKLGFASCLSGTGSGRLLWPWCPDRKFLFPALKLSPEDLWELTDVTRFQGARPMSRARFLELLRGALVQGGADMVGPRQLPSTGWGVSFLRRAIAWTWTPLRCKPSGTGVRFLRVEAVTLLPRKPGRWCLWAFTMRRGSWLAPCRSSSAALTASCSCGISRRPFSPSLRTVSCRGTLGHGRLGCGACKVPGRACGSCGSGTNCGCTTSCGTCWCCSRPFGQGLFWEPVWLIILRIRCVRWWPRPCGHTPGWECSWWHGVDSPDTVNLDFIPSVVAMLATRMGWRAPHHAESAAGWCSVRIGTDGLPDA